MLRDSLSVKRLFPVWLAAGALALVAACSTTVAGHPAAAPAARPSTQTTAGHGKSAPAPKRHHKSKPAVAVHASLLEGDGQTYGVGMPIVMRFDKKLTDPTAFEKAVTVTVGGRPANGAWYFENSPAGFAMEAHYREAQPWPAHSRIAVNAPLKGVSAGRGRAFDDDLTLSMNIGAAHVSTVDFSPTDPHMVVTSDGHFVRRLPVSLGAPGDSTATLRGTKVVEEFDRVENMEGTPVPWSVRITNSGEFVHAAPWNGEIGRANLSHGCTNLSTADAEWFYHFSRLGDLVEYPNAPGREMPVWDGLGDWNATWSEWQAGGEL